MIQTTVDTRGFMRAMALYRQARLNKSYPYIVNRCLRNVAWNAMNLTRKADAGRIRSELSAGAKASSSEYAYWKRARGGGRVFTRRKRPKIVTQWDNSVAARIINARRSGKAKGLLGKRFNVGRYAGKHLLWGKAMDQAAEAMLRARVKAISFIKSGWLPAFRELMALTGREGLSTPDARQRGRPKGTVTPAPKGRAFTFAEMTNTTRGAARVGLAAAQQALRIVSRDIARWAKERLMQDARRSGLRVR